MKRKKHIDKAACIGSNSWELTNFASLSHGASVKRQVAALRVDQSWLRDHIESICREIEQLIEDIQELKR